MRSALHLLAFLAALMTFALDVQLASAQSASCAQLVRNLRQLENNGAFGRLQANVREARNLAADLRDMESRFVRSGCQQQLNNGQQLDRQCRTLASNILRGRDTYNQLTARIETGQAVAQQREQTLQQIARFGCETRPNSRQVFEEQRARSRSPFEQMLDRIFGGEGRIMDDGLGNYLNMSTLRTVCVRASDGYYWPISFSTTEEYLMQDQALCQQQCPNAEVQLFYYSNPGEDPEQMISLYGQRYADTPTAFQYRESFDTSNSCRKPANFGSVQLASAQDGSTRATIQFGELSFPLPMRDPRRGTTVTVAEVNYVPLPRPRPDSTSGASAQPTQVAETRATSGDRVVEFNDRRVRVVGPDTPYAQAGEEAL